ncbi:Hsp20/alpha crystallin family protein [Candidatus Protochlamydia phocaeensis]|uniref:Hsp20/alpha crystallin family protein n=1 Tax=Candidatus Protochlamydia phocaeensis TaxID=1414722 RepID=UPI000838FD79|nr:Hsp20/alpha crystallin family protein [Candidatus Protochlamydia phocaeensis]
MNKLIPELYPFIALQEKLANLGSLSQLWPSSLSQAQANHNVYPPINVFEKNGDWILIAELPGVKKDDLQITVENDTLRLSGKRTIQSDSKASIHRMERSSGQFDRTFHLPFNVDAEKTQAEYQDGVLKIILQRSEKDKPKRVSIK